MWDSLRHKARLNILDYSRIAACLSASAVSSNACLSSLLPLGKHFYQNITRCCLLTDTYTRMKVNSCHIQVNSREVTIFRKHYTPRFMNPDNLTPCTHITHSSQDQDLRIYESISVWGPVCDNGSPFRVFLISQHLKTSIYNLVWVLTSLCGLSSILGLSANQRPGWDHADQWEAEGWCCVTWCEPLELRVWSLGWADTGPGRGQPRLISGQIW